ncbi:ATP-dependent helicase [Columbia Basin potato purple top phytoplasma]|nr:ATP-dependent helicase [Columbia Basin potato purple top phytoplasma]
MTKWLNNLNEQQKAAIETNKKAVYVHAGAGTGKTTTLTNKIIHLINELKIKGQNILVVTFTNNAAKELKERLKKMIEPHILPSLTISTFHSLGHLILRKYISYLDLSPSFFIADEQKKRQIIQEIIKNLKLDKELYKPKEIQKKISRMKTNKIKAEIYKELDLSKNRNVESFLTDKEEQILQLYNKNLKKNNFVDFDDLIIYPYKLLKNNSSIASFYQNKFTHILVDEFQDIDLIQYQLIKIIGQNNFAFVVGDPNQNIYSFRGADAICNKLFLENFKADIFYLKQNYRSTQNILDKANLLIKYNYHNKNNAFQTNLKTNLKNNTSEEGKKIHHYHYFNDAQKEAKFIVTEIKNLVNNKKYNYKDIAILYRSNNLYKEIENSLNIQDIPYVINKAIPLYNKKEIKDFISYLRVLYFLKNDSDFKRIINTPSRQIGKTTIQTLEQIANQKKISLFEAMDHVSDENKIKIKINNLKNIFQKLLNVFYDETKCNLSNVIFLIDEIIQYSNTLSKNKEENTKIKNNLTNLQKIFDEENKKQTQGTFLEKLIILLNKIILSSEKDNNNQDKILLSSIHKVKGLEFKVVFAIGWDNKISKYNKNNMSSGDNEIQEERRIAYVAITRAKELLYLTSSKYRFLEGQKVLREPVSFLKEMELSELEEQKNEDKNTENKHKYKKIFKNETIYKTGDKIIHKTFGKGLIISINKDVLTIIFSKDHGIKKILITHSSLEKI